MFILESNKELTDERLVDFINKHQKLVNERFQVLNDAYMTKYEILKQDKKPAWKPDNRIMVNFAKYIVDTMNGFFIGHPIKTTVESTEEDARRIGEFIEFLDQYNDQDDNNAELSKLCSMFGRGYEIYYLDELANQCIIPTSVLESFMIYDESIVGRPRFFVRLWKDTDKVLHGSVSDDRVVRYFTKPGDIVWENDRERPHGYDGVPATEFRENEEKIGIFEPVLSMINAYNKALSEKANDVDYFADAYLKILGPRIDQESQKNIRANRIMNFTGTDADKIIVDFLTKPDGDNSQEHLIDRLEKLIFQISMVANISDENFGSSSGIALKYKLQAMSNLAKTKERKFISGMNRRYRIIFSNPANSMQLEDWVKLHFHFTQNYPANVSEEIENAKNLEGLVSSETQLKVLSIVEDITAELDRMEEENQNYQSKLSIDLMGDDLNG